MRRREAVTVLGGLLPLPALWQGGDSTRVGERGAPQLQQPGWTGRPREAVTDYQNDPFVIGIETRLRCTCGCNLDVYTCRTTDFTCGTSPAMHREVVALVEQGRTADEIVDAFVAQHGEMVLMAPKKEGFNLLAWFLPGTAIAAVGVLIMWVFTRKTQAAAATADAGSGALSDADRARLDAELRDLEL